MSSRTRVPRWSPPLGQTLRLAWRPVLAYAIFTGGGFLAFIVALVFYGHSSSEDMVEIVFACAAGMLGVFVGQAVAVLRARALPVFVAGTISMFIGIWLLTAGGLSLPKVILPAVAFFLLAFPCGMLSLQHRWELFASFWPACGWIGGVFLILNEEGRVHDWEKDKVTAWLPVPLFFLGCFLVLWIFYLASKQAMRVDLWQALSGAVARRVQKKAAVSAVPRKNVLPLLVVALMLFAITAVLAPYLWRTGKGDKDGKTTTEQTKPSEDPPKPDDGPKFDGQALVKQMQELAEKAKDTALHLWPLLLLLLFYRPAKRALLKTHLLTPVVPTPPTERVENLWEYVRIAAEDAGVVPAPSDSVEQLLVRMREKKLGGPALARAAEIYARTRYGFTVGRGDPLAMRPAAVAAAGELRANLTTWDRVKSWWRPLS